MERLNGAGSAEEIRRVYPRVLAKTLALTQSLADAEDAVHDAIERALEAWSQGDPPESAEAWLLAVAKNRHLDRLRRKNREKRQEDALATLAEMSPWVRIAVGEQAIARGFKDDLLRLLFACCHPVLSPGESAALALSTIIGLSNSEIAQAFLVAPRSMEQRLTRARQRLREHGEYDGSAPERPHERLEAVLRTVHLLFNEGYWSADEKAPIRADLCRLAIGLARSLLFTFPDEPEVLGLLALLLLHDTRRGARLTELGVPVALPDQDRSRWDRAGIEEARGLLDRALALKNPGPFQIEAAISAVHNAARSAEETDWTELAALYRLLETFRPSPAVRVNRAFAVSRAHGAAAGLALLEPGGNVDPNAYPYVHVVRGALLEELGRKEEARTALTTALGLARNEHEAARIRTRLEGLGC